jgi:hypothetical protein
VASRPDLVGSTHEIASKVETQAEVKLVNTSAVRQYDGLKHRDDCDDAFHLAQLLRLTILLCGYIYPRRGGALLHAGR